MIIQSKKEAINKFRYAINYFGYHDSGSNENEMEQVSTLLGIMCAINVLWIFRL